MKLVMATYQLPEKCKLCVKLETKYNRRRKEEEQNKRWAREDDGRRRMIATEKSWELIRQLDEEITNLMLQREKKHGCLGLRDPEVKSGGENLVDGIDSVNHVSEASSESALEPDNQYLGETGAHRSNDSRLEYESEAETTALQADPIDDPLSTTEDPFVSNLQSALADLEDFELAKSLQITIDLRGKVHDMPHENCREKERGVKNDEREGRRDKSDM